MSHYIAQAINTSVTTSTPMGPAWAAVVDAKRYDEANIGSYSPFLKEVGARVKSFVEATFPENRVYLNYRKNFIAVKVEGVSLTAAFSVHTDLLESWAQMARVRIAVRGQNVIFRIYPNQINTSVF